MKFGAPFTQFNSAEGYNMKIIHLSDLHIGKKLNGFSLIEDQRYILNQILDIISREKPECIVIAGDIYDKTVPSEEAVELLDDFLVGLSERKAEVFIISGNHDSAERLSFANRLLDSGGIHISKTYNGAVKPYTVSDEYGTVNFYMLPFVKPVNVKKAFPENNISSYTDAVRTAVENMNINKRERNVMITHQFVTGAQRSESEEIFVGGSDNVDADIFSVFDYTALGHIHNPQNIGTEKIRYCGTPLKYSFSESKHDKSVTVAELMEKGTLSVRTIPLVPMREMTELKGRYNELVSKAFYDNTSYQTDFVHITLTDEENIADAVGKLRIIYKNLMKLDYDNKRTRNASEITLSEYTEHKSPIELFEDFYKMQNNSDMTEEQREFAEMIIEDIWDGNGKEEMKTDK